MKAASAYLICILSKIQLLHRAEAVLQIQIMNTASAGELFINIKMPDCQEFSLMNEAINECRIMGECESTLW